MYAGSWLITGDGAEAIGLHLPSVASAQPAQGQGRLMSDECRDLWILYFRVNLQSNPVPFGSVDGANRCDAIMAELSKLCDAEGVAFTRARSPKNPVEEQIMFDLLNELDLAFQMSKIDVIENEELYDRPLGTRLFDGAPVSDPLRYVAMAEYVERLLFPPDVDGAVGAFADFLATKGFLKGQEKPRDESKEVQLREDQILVLQWLADPTRRNRIWQRSAVSPDSPAPANPKAIGKILNELHNLGLIDCPPREGARVLQKGLDWLDHLAGGSATGH